MKPLQQIGCRLFMNYDATWVISIFYTVIFIQFLSYQEI